MKMTATATTTTLHDFVSIDELYQTAYRRGLIDALDQLAELARDPRKLRGVEAVAEARRRLDVDLAMPCAL
jgi:hypothetical protein